MGDITVNIKKSAFNDAFYPMLNNKDRVKLLWGGRDSGKSDYAALHKVIRCIKLPYFKCILVRKKYNWIKDSQYDLIKEIIYRYGLEQLFTFKLSPLEITCKLNGNKFIARGCDRPEKLKSINNPTDAWYEEANQLAYQDWLTISKTIRGSDDLEELFTFNPEPEEEPEDFWLFKQFFAGQTSKSFRGVNEIEIDGETYKRYYTSLHTTYKNNKWCTPDRAADLEMMRDDEYYYKVWVLGEWSQKIVENRFFNLYNGKEHESKQVQYDPGKKVYVSLDFNLNPFAFIFSHIWRDEYGLHFHVFDEATIPDANIHKGAEYIKMKYGNSLHNMQVTGDISGSAKQFSQVDNASHYQQLQVLLGLRDSQIELHNNPKHTNSRADCNYVFMHYPDFKVNPYTCPNLCRDFATVQADNYGGIIKKDRKKLNQRADHGDAFRYQVNADIIKQWIDLDQKKYRRLRKRN